MKRLWWLLPVALVLALSGCFGPEGNVYLSFDYPYYPDNWNCDDPNIDDPFAADTLYENYNYSTVAGDYYFEYTYDSGANWYWIYYTLTANKGFLFFPGEDARFQIYMYSSYWPDFYQVQGLTSTPSASPSGTTSSLQNHEIPRVDESTHVRKQLGEYTITKGGYILKVRGGVWVPKE